MFPSSIVPTKDGNLIHGPVLEEDPQQKGYARLARFQKGSALRNGRSYVALGALRTAVAAGAAVTITWVIQEPGYLGKLCLQSATDLLDLFVTELSIRGDNLFSGDVIADMFRPDSMASPLFGHYIDTNTRLVIGLRNSSAAAMDISPTFALI